ncbi:3-oxo-tetronate kinase [Pseudomonas typographi]|uniref:3-oxo-tetronate kinase n=1 Tax=Pseudomonas typographi TaxID=2715964 RepID=A0ABR7Z7C7_9PSED|nr:3-oxo-tetronate kinase [Pseudomonas typographi]MBD1554002.1 four-carbon acid sugar kinase family protein [Pseudomonas typographi]MBD1589254.1 four-carbon acid sugar kinase family protein [Pseudomonas typographi]MBD1601282.1 four-carbon acid sugar kinase family protein [Pseudomonas typographi]
MTPPTSRPLLGCIADDFTGATDLANILVRGGMRTVQTIAVPAADAAANLDADALVVALKSRTVPAAHAVEASLQALRWLQAQGCRQFFFKYCSTFDSTPAGNIGPVAEALLNALGSDFSIACPAFPEAGRTVFRGHLFVHDALLSESGMEHHPLTPMGDANLVRVLQAQSEGAVGLLRYDSVAAGAEAIASEFQRLRKAGVRLAIADAISDADLNALGLACAGLPLITGGSGVAQGLPGNFRRQGLLREGEAAAVPAVHGPAVVLAGSASKATQGQVAAWLDSGRPALRIDPLALAAAEPVVAQALAFAAEHTQPVLIYATSAPETVKRVQAELGVERAGALVENALGQIAKGLSEGGTRCFVVAGGETSGAVVQALGIKALQIGRQIDPGVPATLALGGAVPLALALKSGNFGSVDFFDKALRRLAGDWA